MTIAELLENITRLVSVLWNNHDSIWDQLNVISPGEIQFKKGRIEFEIGKIEFKTLQF